MLGDRVRNAPAILCGPAHMMAWVDSLAGKMERSKAVCCLWAGAVSVARAAPACGLDITVILDYCIETRYSISMFVIIMIDQAIG